MKTNTANPEEGNLISKVTTLLDSNVQYSTKNHKAYRKQRLCPVQKEKKVKSTEAIAENNQMSDIVDEDFKKTISKILKELKECV